MKSRLLATGHFSSKKVNVNLNLSNRQVSPELEKQIDTIWAEHTFKAKIGGKELYDSECYRLNSLATNDGVLSLDLGPVQYKVHAALKELWTSELVDENNCDKLIIVDSLLKTSDGYFVLGSYNKIVEQDEVYFIGGSCSKSRYEIQAAADLFAYLNQRLERVLCIKQIDIKESTLVGVIFNRIGCVNIIFHVKLSVSREVLECQFRPNSGVSQLVFVKAEGIRSFLSKAENYISAASELA